MTVALLLSYHSAKLSAFGTVSALGSFDQATLCQKGKPIAVSIEAEKAVEAVNDVGADNMDTLSLSCTSSLQMVPVEKQSMPFPSEGSLAVPTYKTTLSSQGVIYREPDPPRLV